jgi:hypothetical protein
MKSKKLAGKKVTPSTQHHLDIAEIRDDVVILNDGTLRSVLLVSSINFSLKSEDEQNAIIGAYISFLNSLEFPLQIVIQSRPLDIDSYLAKLKTIEKEQTNELLRIQTADYRQYVTELVQLGEIMTKRFYVTIPYDPASDKQRSWFRRFMGVFSAASQVRLSQDQFQKRRHALTQRVEHVLTGLNSMSLRAVTLDTQGLIELYYNTYNPQEHNRERMVTTDKLQLDA